MHLILCLSLQTVAQDFSARFIDACLQLLDGQSLTYFLTDVAKLKERQATFPPTKLPPNITFKLVSIIYDHLYLC